MVLKAVPIFIGHESREAEATHVAEASLLKHAKVPVMVQRLHEPALRHVGLYHRQWLMQGNQRVDAQDRRPFSTSFAFLRFMVPSLVQHTGWALFMDGDFLVRADIGEVFAQADPRIAVHVVQHRPLSDSGAKMDGQMQQPYYRKNWSSFCLFNAGHPSNQRLTPHVVNRMPGQWLHAFSWLEDSEIGRLDPRWNYLVGIDKITADAKAAHFTMGIPLMPGHENDHLADEWRSYLPRAAL